MLLFKINQQAISMKSTENIIKKQNSFNTFEDIAKTATQLSKDISLFLSEEIDELNISAYVFRSGMERSVTRVLNALYKQPQPVVIFPDSVPGFTIMAFKKVQPPVQPESKKVNRNATEEIKEIKALDTVIAKFFAKNQQRVMIIENTDLIFALFPVADTRKNLKEMELYIRF